jgi:hypothetical protein
MGLLQLGWMRGRSQSRARCWSCLSVSALLLVEAIAVGCQKDDSRVRIQLHDLPSDKAAVATKPVEPPPICPPAGIAPLQPGAAGTGDHKVTLTWNASAQSNNLDSAAVGYCLYRSQKKNLAKKNAICKDCEQVNRVPIPSTGCIDDLVADSAQYYYVVTAINAKGSLSSASNEIPVRIPSAQSVKATRLSQLPLCRAGVQGQAR